MIKVDWHRLWTEKPWKRGTHFLCYMGPSVRSLYDMEHADFDRPSDWESVWASDHAMIHAMYAAGNSTIRKYSDLY